jgi:hypothetical protein
MGKNMHIIKRYVVFVLRKPFILILKITKSCVYLALFAPVIILTFKYKYVIILISE